MSNNLPNVEEAKTVFGPIAKAVVGAVVGAVLAFATSVATALSGDAATFADITDGQWVAAVVAALSTLPIVGGSVWAVTNRPAKGSHAVTQYPDEVS